MAGFEIDLELLLQNRTAKKISLVKATKEEDITITTDKTYGEVLKELQTKYPEAEITPGTIYQAENQSTRNITFHLRTI